MQKRLHALLGWRLEAVAFVVGLVVLAFELTASRIVAPYLGTTIYTWTSIIGVILAALAVGYAWGGAWADKRRNSGDIVFLLLMAASVITLMALIKDWLLAFLTGLSWPLQLQGLLASLWLFALPTILLGAVSPYLARLNITDINSSGKKLSRINAAGTIGSLAGTFLTGYVLFGLVGTRNLLVVLAVCLVLVSFLLETSKQNWARLAFVICIIGLGHFSSSPRLSGYERSIDTDYSRVIIRDIIAGSRPVRALQTDNDGLQSGVYLDHKPGLAFDYVRGFAYAAALQPVANRYLIIGGGAFTFPEFLASNVPAATVDTIEIDPQLVTISQAYFNFQKPVNLHIITADGRQFLNSNRQRYDMIFLDAFTSVVPPFQLTTTQAVERMHKSLTDDGMVVTNVIAGASGPKSELLRAFVNTYEKSFSRVSVYRVDPALPTDVSQNLLLIASNQPLDQKRLTRLTSTYPEFSAMVKAKVNLPRGGKVLTDDFAPVEQLAAR